MDEKQKKTTIGVILAVMVVAFIILLVVVVVGFSSPKLFVSDETYVDSLIVEVNKIIV